MTQQQPSQGPSNVTVRRAVAEDAPTVASFVVAMAMESEKKTVDPEVALTSVQTLIQTPTLGHYYVAIVDGTIAGSCMITYEFWDYDNSLYWWLQSVYVHPDFRSRGVFKRLYEYVREDSKAPSLLKCSGIRLYVEKSNTSAQQVYTKLGLQPSHYLLFESDE